MTVFAASFQGDPPVFGHSALFQHIKSKVMTTVEMVLLTLDRPRSFGVSKNRIKSLKVICPQSAFKTLRLHQLVFYGLNTFWFFSVFQRLNGL